VIRLPLIVEARSCIRLARAIALRQNSNPLANRGWRTSLGFNDLRSAFLVWNSRPLAEVKECPTINFKSSAISLHGDELRLEGNLTIHGVTKQVVLKVEVASAETKDPWGNARIGASATTRIKRSDFCLNWNAALETGGFLVGDNLKIELDASLIKA